MRRLFWCILVVTGGVVVARGGPAASPDDADRRPPDVRIASLGILTADPQLETGRFLAQCDEVGNRIKDRCKYNSVLLPQRYIAQGTPAGSGSGTAEDPYLVSPVPVPAGVGLISRIESLEDEFPAGVVIWIHADLVARLSDDATIKIDTPFTHLRGWDPTGAGRRPTLHKWSDYAPAWAARTDAVTGRTYYATPYSGPRETRLAMGTPVDDPDAARYHGEAFVDAGARDRFDHLIFRDVTNAFFVDQTAGELLVYLKGERNPSAFPVQMCSATANLVQVEADGAVLDSLHLNGGDQVNESYVAKCVAPAVWTVRRCFLADAYKHILGLVGPAASGAITLSEHNTFVGGRAESAGFTTEVSYATEGDTDYLSVHNDFVGGAYGPDRTRATLLYSHASASAGDPAQGSIILADFKVRTTGFTGISRYLGVSHPDPTRQVYAQVAGDVSMNINGWTTRTSTGGSVAPPAFDAVVSTAPLPIDGADTLPLAGIVADVTYDAYPDVNRAAYALLTEASGVIYNCEVRVHLPTPSSDPPGDDRANIYRFQSTGTFDLEFRYCTFYCDYAGGDETLNYFVDLSPGPVRFYECLWYFEGATPQMRAEASGRFNTDANTATKGMAECAFKNIASADTSKTLDPVFVTDPLDLDVAPAPESPLVLTPDAVNPSTYPATDAYGQARSPALPTIGARTAIGVEACRADIDGNGTLNLDDIAGFAAAFLGGDDAADLNLDGALNLDDIQLFVESFLAGCP
ncbi:MAG: GC-type dockerin domain-anchored protein [Phycisphaerales bacterium]